jgi:16S rRNA (cytosine967-C5)-methyltransferase
MPRILVSAARRAAFDILRRVESEGAYASALLAALPEERLSREDRGLTQELVLGVLRWQRTLDYFIERYSGRAPSGMDAAVRIALRIGLYQLRYLSRIPSHAAVNESVNLVKTCGAKSAAGLVNAVLRKAVRQPDDQAGNGINDPGERAAIELSHPRWMIERWRTILGENEARALALANNQPQPFAFRVNTLRSSKAEALDFLKAAGVNVRRSAIVPDGYVIERGAGPAIADAVRRGMIYLQDQASQLVSLLLEARAGDRVLDLCAAPGSKTSHIADLTGNGAWIVACDIHPHRIATLGAICKSLGVECVDPLVLDAAASDLPFTAAFDRVLVDAPCTGTGTLRENPEIKWRLAPDDVARLAKIQVRLLENASRVVAEGGRVVYSTCSIEREEGEDVVQQFLQSSSGFRLVRPDVDSSLVTTDGFVRTYPHTHGTAGFFAAVLERIGG